MLRVIQKLLEGLERLKGFNTGYSTRSKDKMLIEIEGRVYLLNAKYLGEGTVDDFIDIL